MADNIDNDLLISLVEERPVLWDKTIEEYKDKDKKNSAWKEVCRSIFPTFDEQTNKEKTKIGNEVLKKWKNMKDNFTKYAKRLESLNKSGAGATKVKEYHFYKQLMFLKKNAANVTDSSIVEDQESDEDGQKDETARSRYQPCSRKRKATDQFESDILQALKEAENRHLSFFKAILPSLNKLDDHQTLIFQSRVLQVLTDLHQPAIRGV
ncbi:uncharacterized protein LOC134661570 [Cydia amplana]|uniref:uncharacterized protein LOC134661570 n=1 Tax=Cydia amplana TaxID=1869771 RepID=UPI002FE6833A